MTLPRPKMTHPGPSTSSHSHHRFTRDQLNEAEKHLDDHEKMSLVLLFDVKVIDAIELIINNIINQTSEDGVLWHIYRSLNDVKNFDAILRETLFLIQNVLVAKCLGLPSMPIKNVSVISPIRKGLFKLCDNLPVNKVRDLVEYIKQDFDSHGSFLQVYSEDYMELNILFLLMNNYISESPCDFENLVKILQKIGQPDLAHNLDVLEKICNENYERVSVSEYQQAFDGINHIPFRSMNSPSGDGARGKVALPYEVDPSCMGLCVIINQESFSQKCKKMGLENRYGTNADQQMLKITFESFGYEIRVLKDLNFADFSAALQKIKSMIGKKHSSFVLCILTHGIKGAVYCTDGLPFYIEDIEKTLLHDTCSKLLGKPKVLIVQACQGKQRLQAMEVDSEWETDGPMEKKVTSPVADLTTFVATCPGYASVRHRLTGSLFIQTLCKQLLQQSSLAHLTDIYTSVKDELSSSARNVQTPQLTDTNTKKLYFPSIIEKRRLAAKSLLEKYLFDELCEQYLFRRAALLVFLYKKTRGI